MGDLETQWPPEPTNARRVESIGRLRMEFDGDSMHATQPSHLKRRRNLGWFTAVAGGLELMYIGYQVVSSRLPWGVS